MAHLVFAEVALQITLIALVVNIIGAVVIEVVVEVEAVVASDAILDSYACSIASDEVIGGIRLALIITNNGWSVESIV